MDEDEASDVEFARRVYTAMALSLAVYEEPAKAVAQINDAASFHRLDRVRRSESNTDNESSPFLLAESDSTNTVYLAVAGTENIRDVVTDMSFFPKRTQIGQFHQGFLERAYTVKLDPLLRQLRKQRRLVLTGHSLGGAIACVLALRLFIEAAPDIHEYLAAGQISVITFAQPAVGDEALAKFVDANPDLESVFHRFVLPGDVIPRLHALTGRVRQRVADLLAEQPTASREKINRAAKQGAAEAASMREEAASASNKDGEDKSNDVDAASADQSGIDAERDVDDAADSKDAPTAMHRTMSQLRRLVNGNLLRANERSLITYGTFGKLYILRQDKPLQPLCEREHTDWIQLPDEPSVDAVTEHLLDTYMDVMRGVLARLLGTRDFAPPTGHLVQALALEPDVSSVRVCSSADQHVKLRLCGRNLCYVRFVSISGIPDTKLQLTDVRLLDHHQARLYHRGTDDDTDSELTDSELTDRQGRVDGSDDAQAPRSGEQGNAKVQVMTSRQSEASVASVRKLVSFTDAQVDRVPGWLSYWCEATLRVPDHAAAVRTGTMITLTSSFGSTVYEVPPGVIRPFPLLTGTAAGIAVMPLKQLLRRSLLRSLLLSHTHTSGSPDRARELLDTLDSLHYAVLGPGNARVSSLLTIYTRHCARAAAAEGWSPADDVADTLAAAEAVLDAIAGAWIPSPLSWIPGLPALLHRLVERPLGVQTYMVYLRALVHRLAPLAAAAAVVPEIPYHLEAQILHQQAGADVRDIATGHVRIVKLMHQLRSRMMRDFVLAVVGTTETGKTELVSQLHSLHLVPTPRPSAVARSDCPHVHRARHTERVCVIDFPGSNSIDARVADRYARSMDVLHSVASCIVVVLDVAHVEREQAQVLRSAQQCGVPVLVCFNKADLWCRQFSSTKEAAAAYDARRALLAVPESSALLTSFAPAATLDTPRFHSAASVTRWLWQHLGDAGVERVDVAGDSDSGDDDTSNGSRSD